MTKLTEWYPIYLKEMLLFKRKLFKLGYLFSAMVVPIIYLVAFGFGLGRSVQTGRGTYLDFLIPGLVAMSSMNNSYSWVASALNLNRLYFKTFQVFVQAPISPFSIMIGEVLAGMTKGLFASVLIMAVGFAVSTHFRVTPLFVMALLLNCFLFACLGIVTGMVTKSHEDTVDLLELFHPAHGLLQRHLLPRGQGAHGHQVDHLYHAPHPYEHSDTVGAPRRARHRLARRASRLRGGLLRVRIVSYQEIQ